MAGWYHRCNRHELGQILGDGEGEGGLFVLQSIESDKTGQLNIILCNLLPPTTHSVQSSLFIFFPHGSRGKRR